MLTIINTIYTRRYCTRTSDAECNAESQPHAMQFNFVAQKRMHCWIKSLLVNEQIEIFSECIFPLGSSNNNADDDGQHDSYG